MNGILERTAPEFIEKVPEPESKRSWHRYAIALVSVLAAFAIRYWLTRVLGEELPFMFFIAAALVAAWSCGVVMGIVALLLGLFLADAFFLRPLGAPPPTSSVELLQLVRYMFTASLGIALIEVQHRAQRRTQAALEELRREVERRKKSEAALLEAKEELGRLAADLEKRVEDRTVKLGATVGYLQGLLYHIGHNLRAPLRAMSGYTTCLLEEYGPRLDATGHAYALHISNAARRMDTLIHGLLDYGRLGHVEVKFSKVSLERVAREAVNGLAFEIESRKAQVKIVGPLPEVWAEAELLEQVLTNLLENAITFVASGKTPEVQLRAEPRGRMVRLWIEDNGIGIEPRHHERIFGVFETLQPVRGEQGDGIGLAIVKQAMERLGGRVGLESELGAGSRFWIELAAA